MPTIMGTDEFSNLLRTEMAKAKPFDAAEYLDSPEMIAAYINEASNPKTHLPSLSPSARLPARAA
jgi:hypothetical protein